MSEQIKVVVPGRFSFLTVFEPRVMAIKDDKKGIKQEPKYSCTLLIKKTDKATIDKINAQCAKAMVEFAKKIGPVKSTTVKNILQDGDVKANDNPDGKYDAYRGHMYISANSPENMQPGIFDREGNTILSPKDIKSGDYGFMSVNIFGYDNLKNGLGSGLQAVKKVKDGEAFGSSGGTHDDFDNADIDMTIFDGEGENDNDNSASDDVSEDW